MKKANYLARSTCCVWIVQFWSGKNEQLEGNCSRVVNLQAKPFIIIVLLIYFQSRTTVCLHWEYQWKMLNNLTVIHALPTGLTPSNSVGKMCWLMRKTWSDRNLRNYLNTVYHVVWTAYLLCCSHFSPSMILVSTCAFLKFVWQFMWLIVYRSSHTPFGACHLNTLSAPFSALWKKCV